MILSLGNASEKVIEEVRQNLLARGLENTLVKCAKTTLVVITSDADSLPGHIFSQMDGVQKVVRLSNRSPLGKDLAQTVVTLSLANSNSGLVQIGGGRPPIVISGPCAIEGRDQIIELAQEVKASGAVALRGGAYKPRTSAYDFQGLGLDGLKYMKEAGLQSGLPVVSEVVSIEQIEPSSPYLDVFQVGARNMYNYELLKELGRQRKPVLLKRGMSATIDELLQAAEYILLEGNLQVILCERGIRTFENRTRNTLDLSAVAVIKSLTSLPVMVDPSHAVGKREFIAPLSRAAIACGADGLIIESHCTPDKSISDAAQAIEPSTLAAIVNDTNT
ncbi:MAG: 3-deoxy-7-phosphoheptulonate synthase, partial [Candidatus Obscuribacterales bacterium]